MFAERGRKRPPPLNCVSLLFSFDLMLAAVELRSRIMFLSTSFDKFKMIKYIVWDISFSFWYFDKHLSKINIWKIFLNFNMSKTLEKYTTVGNCAHGACHRYQKSLLTLNHDISVKKRDRAFLKIQFKILWNSRPSDAQ